MALSIGRMGATTSYSQIRPQSYALSNESQTSAAYEASKTQSLQGIGAVDPVQYPNAQTSGKSLSGISSAQEVEQAYNAIASAFEGVTTFYGQDSVGSSYGMLGSQIDVYA